MSKKLEKNKENFREYFDKNLRPKKPSMKNLDRELCLHFIEKVHKDAQEEIFEALKSSAEVLRLTGYVQYADSLDTVVKALRQ